MAEKKLMIKALLLCSGVLLGGLWHCPPVAAELPDCGTTPAGADAPLKATVEAPTTASELTLGRSESGARRRELEFAFSGECVPPDDVPVRLDVFSGADRDLASDAVKIAKTEIDGSTVRVTLLAMRSRVDPGEYTGHVIVGNSQTGSATTALTIKHQQPFWPGPLLLGVLATLGGIALASIRGGLQRPTTPSLSIGKQENAGGLVKMFWLLMRPFESTGRWVSTFLFSRDGWAGLLGISAAATAFKVAYIGDPAWSLTLATGFALLAAVGGPALVAALAAWQAPQK